MKLKFFSPTIEKKYRASVHRTGKIGLTIETAENFKITKEKSIALAINDEDPLDTSIYGVLFDEVKEDAFKITKAGDYHSIIAKSFFDSIKLDYSKGDIAYEINELTLDGQKILKFSRKIVEKKQKQTEIDYK